MRRSFSVLVLLACSVAWAEDRPVLVPREQPLWVADQHPIVATAAVTGAVVTTLIAVAIALSLPSQHPTGLKFPNSIPVGGP